MKTYILNKNKGNKFDLIYAIILFILLLSVNFPCFSYPPLSDHWETFYFFHHLDKMPGQIKWLHILNHDPVEHVRYQPLSRVPPYIFHLLFGSNFIFFGIFNFLFYFLSIVLLYKFALNFSQNREIIAVFIALFAFLFSHCDIILWSYHIYIIISFCMLLIGFMTYIKYLQKGSLPYLFLTAFFLIGGVLGYETFFFWPFAIVFLSSMKRFKTAGKMNKERIIKSNCVILLIIYIFYFLFYFYTRSLGTYDKPLRQISDFLKLSNFISAGVLAFFNILYNNIAVNIYPLLSFPLKVTENIYLFGSVINSINTKHGIVFIGGSILGFLLIFFFILLFKRRKIEELKILVFLFFLMFTESFILSFFRLGTNEFEYCLTEFRYQYILNALFFLMLIYIFDRFLKPSARRKIVIFPLILLIFALNIYCTFRVLKIYNYQFLNLKKLLQNIKIDMREGLINKVDKLYIDKDLPDYLPNLCWNIEMGERFIDKGNYQWLFSKNEIEYFTDCMDDAAWIVNHKDFSIVKKNSFSVSGEAKRINSITDKDYIDIRKDSKYMDLGHFFIKEKKYERAEQMFKKAIEFNPKNNEAYLVLDRLYKMQGRYKETEEIFNEESE